MTGTSSTLRLGTMNVRSLSGRLGGVFELAKTEQIDVLCLQETRVNVDSWSAVKSAANQRKWQVFPGGQGVDAKNVVIGGTLVLSKWPAEALAIPSQFAPADRAMALKLFRPHQRPLLLINVYLHANDQTAAGHTLASIFEYVAMLGEEAIIVGDFNRERHVWPASTALASGQWYSCDEQICGDQIGPGTHRNSDGEYTGVVIDYALSTPRVVVSGRMQSLGVADHDAVIYDIHVHGSLPTPWRLPASAPLLLCNVEVENWNVAWAESQQDFTDALAVGNVDQAWVVLSNCAESLLLAQGKPSRASRDGPHKMASPPSTKAPTLQSLEERKLRRFARRVVEYQKAPSLQLQTKLLRDAPLLHSSLTAFSLSDGGLAPAALLLADEVAKKASQRRLAAWKEDIQENVAKLGKWVQQKPPDPPTATQVDGPILPEDKARQEAAAWHTHWNPDHLPHLDQVSNLCLQLNNQVDPVTPESIQVVGADLARSALKAKQKAAGMDAWTAAHLCKLPESFWNHVAVLWSACMQCAKVPTMWKDIRIALIPKAAGGLRPLAITTVLWRICMSATLQKLRPWIQEWALPQLCGGRPGRGIMDVHELLYEDIRAAKRSRVDFVGCKADIRRCFDSVCPKTALAIWRWLGAPASLCDMVENFYTDQRRWFAWQGIFHSEPICARRGLLQGCPASPALLNAVMVVWVRFVLLQEPRVSLAVYLDDRTTWKKGVNGIHVVTNAMQAGAQVDAILGMELHPDKLNSFTTKQHLTPQLSQIQDVLGAPCSKFTLLGIQYNLERAGACVNAEKLSFDIQERCRKIRLAAKRLGTRKTLLGQLVISLFAWTGAFHHYDVDTIKSWTSSIEAAVWGRKPAPGRSRLLFWNSLGTPRLHPAFALHFAAARAEWQRQCRLAIGVPAAVSPGPRWNTVCKDWNWRVEGGLWITPVGTLKPGWVSSSSLYKTAAAAWLAFMWTKDNKTEGPLPEGKLPVFQFQANVAHDLNYCGRRVLTGAAVDGRVTQRLEVDLQCDCGLSSPDREHFTFFCEANPWHGDLKTPTERRLLVPLVDAPAVLPFEDMTADPILVAFLQQFDPHQTPTLGLDGSCAIAPGCELWQRASWAVAAHLGPTVNGLVHGFEQTPAAGERGALLQACLASHEANRAVRLLIDNQALAQRLHRGMRLGQWGGDLFPYWHYIRMLLVDGSSCAWIPSHDKVPRWRPPEGWLDVLRCRMLNAKADASAADLTGQFRQVIATCLSQHRETVVWAGEAWKAQLKGSLPYWQVLLEHEPRQNRSFE